MSAGIKTGKDLSGLKAYVDELERNQVNYYKILAKKIQIAFLKEVQKRAPKDTGEYAKSWKAGEIKIDGTKVLIIIETPMGQLYVILEEEGSDPHEIEGNPLHWTGGKYGPGEHFAMKVDHPGFPPIPHVQPSIRHIMDTQFDKINDEALREAFPNVFQ